MTPDDLFGSYGDLRREKHTLPDGKTVYVGEISCEEWGEIEGETFRESELHGKDRFYNGRWFVRSLVNEDNTPVFARPILNGDPDHDKAVRKKYQEALEKIAAMPYRVSKPILDKINRMNYASIAEYEQIKKKLGTATSDGSSNSPETQETSLSEGLPKLSEGTAA